ncbi:glutamate racemase [Candidatus Nitrosotenuis cloacae]|uniref:Glutamate racemase n=1 Tax=Candidatus Nitrosotenuis cloacae TaxID=1603555 RepID=A0A3G1B1S8_9ARCH|nr:aspartate/glutamate racemase family protein [Candidatus Nitrosotenuis cloacae]AJZ76088.1 hypothetical protein SU86_006555 [Candidatus Nitrosotenuis cloacae]
MGKIVVFDSGLGSLSVIQAIRKTTKADIVYFADQKNYPYGTKNTRELGKIIEYTIHTLQEKFNPDIIVVGSNTPTVLFPDLFTNDTILGVSPPLPDAIKYTKTGSIAVLGTLATINSRHLNNQITNTIPKNILITKIDSTELIDLVEAGKFLNDIKYCKSKIKNVLKNIFSLKKIDVATLSSTHLPFLDSLLKEMFPNILFLDPAVSVAQQILKNKKFHPSQKNSLNIYASGNVKNLQTKLEKLQIKNKIHHLEF